MCHAGDDNGSCRNDAILSITRPAHRNPAPSDNLMPVKALSRIFRAKFRDALRKHDPNTFAEILAEVMESSRTSPYLALPG